MLPRISASGMRVCVFCVEGAQVCHGEGLQTLRDGARKPPPAEGAARHCGVLGGERIGRGLKAARLRRLALKSGLFANLLKTAVEKKCNQSQCLAEMFVFIKIQSQLKEALIRSWATTYKDHWFL